MEETTERRVYEDNRRAWSERSMLCVEERSVVRWTEQDSAQGSRVTRRDWWYLSSGELTEWGIT